MKGGRPFPRNGRLARELAWALGSTSPNQPHVGLYMNTANPGPASSTRRGLNRVGLIRLGASASMAIPPFVDWPPDLVAALGGQYAMVEGGFEFDGREILPLDVEAVRAAAERFKGEVDSIAIVGVFSAVDASQEARAAEIVLRVDVLGIPAPPQLTTEQALQYVGPRAFGYTDEYRPLKMQRP